MQKPFRIVLIAVVSVLLGLATFYLGLWTGLSPRIWVWKWMYPDPQLTSIGSMLITAAAIDSVFWFIVLLLGAFIIDRTEKTGKAE